MSLFACKKCNSVDERELHDDQAKEDLCTECKTGTWHDHFDKKPYDTEMDVVDNRTSGVGLG